MNEQLGPNMLESVRFENFRVLRDATLPLQRLTLIVGPNGSGKSTAIQALQTWRSKRGLDVDRAASAHVARDAQLVVSVTLQWIGWGWRPATRLQWTRRGFNQNHIRPDNKQMRDDKWEAVHDSLSQNLKRLRVFSLDADAISAPVQLDATIELERTGARLAGVLDRLRDTEPERFEALNAEVSRWLPEFDRILFDTPGKGMRSFLLRTREGQHAITATDLSQGTVLSLTILTLAYLPDPPPIVCFEEPDRGIHPRLLRDVRDALYRLSYPEDYGDMRPPVQVIATTHSPYMLDLFRDHPEQIVIAEKTGREATFQRLIDRPDIDEILQDTPLGDAWYSGILGGVPCER